MTSVSIRTLGFILTFLFIANYFPLINADSLTEARKAGLDQHNKYRALHNATPLVLDETINSIAQAWAENLLGTHTLFHNGIPYGENLYKATGSLAKSRSKAATDATDKWYNEVCGYKSHGYGPSKQYTQLVWAKSTKLGIGIALSESDNRVYVVANYHPTGNLGTFNDKSVPPASCAKVKMLCKKEKVQPLCAKTGGKVMASFWMIMVTTVFVSERLYSEFAKSLLF